ncbi:hypothetical protein [Candidatus Accumulibacter cognatus]|nr:hypothetical protein [Candidatus Accumulibacter cognatus]
MELAIGQRAGGGQHSPPTRCGLSLMCASRNTMSGRFAASNSFASRPLRASPTIAGPGHKRLLQAQDGAEQETNMPTVNGRFGHHLGCVCDQPDKPRSG